MIPEQEDQPVPKQGSATQIPISAAVAIVANRLNIPLDDAYAALLGRIENGDLQAEGVAARGESIDIRPQWVRWIAKFEISSVPMRDVIWFDTRRATEEWQARRRELAARDTKPGRWPL